MSRTRIALIVALVVTVLGTVAELAYFYSQRESLVTTDTVVDHHGSNNTNSTTNTNTSSNNASNTNSTTTTDTTIVTNPDGSSVTHTTTTTTTGSATTSNTNTQTQNNTVSSGTTDTHVEHHTNTVTKPTSKKGPFSYGLTLNQDLRSAFARELKLSPGAFAQLRLFDRFTLGAGLDIRTDVKVSIGFDSVFIYAHQSVLDAIRGKFLPIPGVGVDFHVLGPLRVGAGVDLTLNGYVGLSLSF